MMAAWDHYYYPFNTIPRWCRAQLYTHHMNLVPDSQCNIVVIKDKCIFLMSASDYQIILCETETRWKDGRTAKHTVICDWCECFTVAVITSPNRSALSASFSHRTVDFWLYHIISYAGLASCAHSSHFLLSKFAAP